MSGKTETVTISKRALAALRSLERSPNVYDWSIQLPSGGRFKMEVSGGSLSKKDAKLIRMIMPLILEIIDEACDAEVNEQIEAEVVEAA